MSSSGATLRPRYGRIAAFVAAACTTLVSVVGTGLPGPGEDPADRRSGMALSGAAVPGHGAASPGSPAAASAAAATAPSTALRASLSVGVQRLGATTGAAAETALPAGTGAGRRVVFAEGQQRVWLVGPAGRVARTYLVSGSAYDNLDPGRYEVYSRSRTATGIDGSDLRWMVRFAHGDNAAIGFHWIPRVDGERMQTRASLGTPLSHGCIRQATPDARALWRFAPVGTPVVVTA